MGILVAHIEAGGVDNCASCCLSLCTWQCCVQQSFGAIYFFNINIDVARLD